MSEQFKNLADYICLVYHEARNVRHPISAGKLIRKSKFEKLLNLPKNRDKAWLCMGKVRAKAALARKASEAAQVFKEEYDISLEELLKLYREPCWKISKYGGNKWAPICSMVINLIESLDYGDHMIAFYLLEKIPQMKHHTGTVAQKLLMLKESAEAVVER